MRKPLSKRTRFAVFKRDGFVCQYCGKHPPDVILECDHIVPVAEGGGDDEPNLVTACFDCNRGKADIPLSVIPQSLADKAAEMREREDQLAGYREIAQERADRIEEDMWRVADELETNASTKGFRRDYLRSIKLFNDRLPLHSVLDAAELARAKFSYSLPKRFKYFCGICWNKIKRGEE